VSARVGIANIVVNLHNRVRTEVNWSA
jgi:hypothetical protein